jgi:tRNA pseudouridine38-40 synthase
MNLAYHGGQFAGWASQPGMRTVQSELEAALERILGARAPLTVAGRTDAGVHAWGQVASFDLDGDPPVELARALNSLTGPDLAVLSAEPAAGGFDARRDARSRTYCYRVFSDATSNPFEAGVSLFWPHRVDRAALAGCADVLRGTHDFTAFTPTETQHDTFVRTVHHAAWTAAGEELRFTIAADSFLRHMVRTLVGTMLASARGEPIGDAAVLLAGAPRSAAGPTAPPHGLYLAGVRFEGEEPGRELVGIH